MHNKFTTSVKCMSITVLHTCLGVGVYYGRLRVGVYYTRRDGYFVSNEDTRSAVQAQVPQNTYMAVCQVGKQHLELVGC